MLLSFPIQSHPGRTNAEGCHNDRSNGTYHCHNAGRATPPRSVPGTSNTPVRPSVSGDVHYRNCTEARAAGAAPVRRGQPGYGPHL
ncbi:MAG: excalibur calcium-binding domain-containing protein [Pseudohongiella sp.]|nr:excalibur calcium-binding domain-containing protein [Pseudohongiella sp.]